MPEQYFNNFATTVAVGGYTAGSLVLNVAATAGITLAAGDTCHLLVYRLIGGVPTTIVNLTASAVASSTQFTVAAEGTDANALATDNVICVLSIGSMNQIRKDQCQIGTYANLPGTGSQKQGNQYICTDSPYDFVFDGSVWQAFWSGNPVGVPPASLSTAGNWVNQASATVSVVGGIPQIIDTANENGIHGFFISAPSTPYTITALLRATIQTVASNDFPNFGIGFSDGTKYEVFVLYLNTGSAGPTPWYVNVDRWNTTTSSTSGVSGPNLFTGLFDVWLRIKDDGTNRIYSWSFDGVNFNQLTTVARTTFLTASKIGWLLRTQGSHTQIASLISWVQT